jgi:hypothetical protein
MAYENCGERKNWMSLVYKGQSYVRYPKICLDCGNYKMCVKEVYAIDVDAR